MGILINIFDVSPDGRLVFDQSDLLWEVKGWGRSGQNLHGANADASLLAIDFNPTGTLIATADDDHTVRLWDLDDHAEMRRFELDKVMTSVLTDGTHLLAGGDGVYWLNITSGDVIYDLSFENGGPGPGGISRNTSPKGKTYARQGELINPHPVLRRPDAIPLMVSTMIFCSSSAWGLVESSRARRR